MSARERILARLGAGRGPLPAEPPAPEAWYAAHARRETTAERLQRFRVNIEAAHAEVHLVSKESWLPVLSRVLAEKRLSRLLLSPATEHGRRAQAALTDGGIRCRAYDSPVDDWKDALFTEVDASLTAARCAIAETGTLVLWPDADEPRLMSLVPPVHVVLLDAAAIHATLFDAMRAENWAAGMPTNTLLVSGPSKTADIQQTLAYGAHGPKELIVLIKEEQA